MDNQPKIQQMKQILCDAEDEVWLFVSNLLHTHSQVTGLKIGCCVVNSSFNTFPNQKTTETKKIEPEVKKVCLPNAWIPIEKMPIIKTASNIISTKIVIKALVMAKIGGKTKEFTVNKCNKHTVELTTIDTLFSENYPYSALTHVNASIIQHLSKSKAKAVKDVLNSINEDEWPF